MDNFTKTDLEEAQRAITSMINKCEKAHNTMSQGATHASQLTLLKRRIQALKIASSLITRELNEVHE